jgi:quercetin dioxygenase-like cupin family protein
MRRLSLYVVLVFMGLIFIGATEASAQKKMKKEAAIRPAEDIKWEQIKGAPAGVMTANLWGDQTKGAYGGLTKFPAGFQSPLHYHTNDIKLVVIQGAYMYNGKKYGPGSYLFIPGGDKHVSGGVDDSESIYFIEQPGKFDLKPVEPPKKKK